MRIAFFNWRDIRHPLAGGSEVYVHQILKQFSANGHKTTLFCSTFPGCQQIEMIDGIKHMRYGGRFLMYPKVYSCYKKHIEGNFDVIVESINGVPFFTTLFAKEKVVPFIHQLTRENWYSGLPFPLASLGFYLEDDLLSLYRKNPTVVPSDSTKSDLKKLGFQDIEVIHAAHDVVPPKKISKNDNKSIIYLGRLTKSKRVDHVLYAFKQINNSLQKVNLWIVGCGPEEKKLKQLAKDLGISDQTVFFGKVSQKKKAELLSRAHIKLLPAIREGWGLVVLEANACATPVIGYNIPGLRDSITNGKNGYIVDDGDIVAMAKTTIDILEDDSLLKNISTKALDHSKKFTWKLTSKNFISFLERVCNE